MKKLNITAANAIVGGCKKNCTVEYVKASDTVCNAVTTCVDKKGNKRKPTTKKTNMANCA